MTIVHFKVGDIWPGLRTPGHILHIQPSHPGHPGTLKVIEQSGFEMTVIRSLYHSYFVVIDNRLSGGSS